MTTPTADDKGQAPAAAITEDEIFAGHHHGKLAVELTRPLETQRDLSIAYTPGVAQVSRAIAADATTPPMSLPVRGS